MQAGQTLDELIALDVMEWTPHGQGFWIEDPQERDLNEFCPSSNIAHAWEVVERFDAWAIGKRAIEGDGIGCTVHVGREWYEATAPTAPLAICLAALKAVGVEVPTNA